MHNYKELTVLFMLTNRTRTDLTLAKGFYANIPEGVVLHKDWAALDQSCTFALIEAQDQSLIEDIQRPFRPYVDIDIVAVREITGWEVT